MNHKANVSITESTITSPVADDWRALTLLELQMILASLGCGSELDWLLLPSPPGLVGIVLYTAELQICKVTVAPFSAMLAPSCTALAY